ncbi:MAG TPA: diguanylate cyclase [Anaerolineaceae bacterium]|nr:diguanylate cyclase [Anaerolineaceae bacterium]
MAQKQNLKPNNDQIGQVVSIMNDVLQNGESSSELPQALSSNLEFQELMDQLNTLQQFTMALARGDLSLDLNLKGKIAGSLKSLQAQLRHLTWQVQQIADGDLSQRVAFMGDFATSFNTMVEHISQSQEALQQHADELAQQRKAALNLMLDAQSSRAEIEEMYQRLQDQLVENQALQAMLQEQAIRDGLTGLYNRRYLEETLRRELARADRENYAVSVIMLDIDHFKILNDTYGHQAGDIVLQTLGKQLLFRTRFSDIPCRYGGEEFVIIMPNVSIDIALKRAEELRIFFGQTKITYEGQSIQATFSAGLSVYPRDDCTADGLIHAADVAMYAAKSAGRNSVVSLG